MKAIVKTKREYGAVEVLEYPEPTAPVDNEVIIEVKSSAICGSDLHSFEYIPSSHQMKIPVILGHEFSGIVQAIGPSVKDFAIGDRVMGESNIYCDRCTNCRSGKTNVCTNSIMRGITGDGVMASIVKLEERFLHHISNNLSFDEAAVAQPISVSIHGVYDNCNVMPGDDVVVFGPGIMGYVAAQLARSQGAKNIFLVGTNADVDKRLPIAKEMGFIPINSQETSIDEEIKSILGKDSVDVVIECSGSPIALNDGIRILRKDGWLTILGIFSKPAEVDMTNVVRKELNLRVSYTSTWKNYETALSLLSDGILNIKPLCCTYPIEQAIQAFHDAISKTVIKPILNF